MNSAGTYTLNVGCRSDLMLILQFDLNLQAIQASSCNYDIEIGVWKVEANGSCTPIYDNLNSPLVIDPYNPQEFVLISLPDNSGGTFRIFYEFNKSPVTQFGCLHESMAGNCNNPDLLLDLVVDKSPTLSFDNSGSVPGYGNNAFYLCENEDWIKLSVDNGTCIQSYSLAIDELFSPFVNCTTLTGGTFALSDEIYISQQQLCTSTQGALLYNQPGGEYKVTLSWLDDEGNNGSKEYIWIRSTTPTSIVPGNNIYNSCEGTDVNMTASGQGNLTWSPSTFITLNNPNGNNVVAVNPSQSITYTVSSDAYCVDNAIVDLNFKYFPVVDFGLNPQTICSDQVPYNIQKTITENGVPSSGGSYLWNGICMSNLTTSNPTWGPGNCAPAWDTEGNKSVGLTYTSSAGCQSNSETWDFYYSKLEVSLSESNVSCSNSTNAEATITANISGGASEDLRIEWLEWNGTSWTSLQITDPISSSSPTLNVTSSGTYRAEVSYSGTTPVSNCIAMDELVVDLSTHSLTATILSTPLCEYTSSINQYGSVELEVVDPYLNSVANDYTISVSSSIGNSSYALSSLTPTLSLTGVYGGTNYTVNVAHTNGCVATETFTVGATNFIDVSYVVDDATCNGKSDGSVALTINSNIPTPYGYSFLYGGPAGQTTVNSGPLLGVYIGSHTIGTKARTFNTARITAGSCDFYTPSITIVNEELATDLYDLAIGELTGAECYGVANGTLEANASSGSAGYDVGPWDFAWSNGVTETNVYVSTQSGFLAGSHAVTITDKPGSNDALFDGCKLAKTGTLNNLGSNKWQEHTNPSQAGYESHVTSMAIDDQENVYVAGTFTNDLTIQGQTATNTNAGNEFFIASFDVCGALRWLDYSSSEFYTFEDIQLTEHDGTVYLANLPSVVGFGNPIVVLDGSANPVSSTFQMNQNVFGLQEIEASSGAVLQTTIYPAFVLFNTDEIMDIEKNQDNLFIAGQFSGKAGVYQVDVASVTLNNIWDDLYSNNNVFTDLELDANGNMYVSGTANDDIDVDGAGTYTPTGTSDAFIAYRDNTGTVFGFTAIDASIDGESTGLELVGTTQIALVGNYTGVINGYGGGTITSYDNQMGFIANISQSSSLGFNWLKTLEGPTTTPVSCNSLNNALCNDVSVNTNGDVFVYGTFDGSSMEITEFAQNANTPGDPQLQNIWNGKLGGFNTSSFSIDWLSSMSSTAVTPVDMVSGSSNNYIAGDFEESMAIGNNTILSASGPNLVSSYFIRFGDAIDPNQGAYYKTDGSETALDAEFLQLYPNPSTGKINLVWEANDVTFNLNIKDVTGRLIFSQSGLNGKEAYASIDVSTFDAGTYFLSFESELGTVVKPFIKH